MNIPLTIALEELEALRALLRSQEAARAKNPALAHLYATILKLSDKVSSANTTDRFRRVNSD